MIKNVKKTVPQTYVIIEEVIGTVLQKRIAEDMSKKGQSWKK